METRLNKLENDWSNLKDIIIFGYGRAGKKALEVLKKDFHVIAIIDNDMNKVGKQIDDIPIIKFDDACELIKNNKLIVTTQEYYYREVFTQLRKAGFQENKDFVGWRQFVIEWYYKYKNKVNVEKICVYLTSYCSLNCEKCHVFMPYWKNRQENDIQIIKNDFKLLFDCIDFVFSMDIAGGEPFLYSKLSECLEVLGKNYRNKIGYLGVTTNGTILPDDGVLDVIKRYDINISISDYSQELKYQDKIEALCEKLKKKEIMFHRNTGIKWFDFGFPKEPYMYDDLTVQEHMKKCNTVCHALENGKLYYCGTDLAAQKGKLFPESRKSYIDLKKIDKFDMESRKKISELCLGNVEGGYLNFCKVCGGFGIDNQKEIPTAKQMKFCERSENESYNFGC